MRFYGTLDSLLAYAPSEESDLQPVDESEKDQPGDIHGLASGKLKGLAEILDDIGHDVRHRRWLSDRLVEAIYEHYVYVKSKLLELYLWPFGANQRIEQRRSALEKQLDTLKAEKRNEQRECWRDVAELKTEFRRWMKQYRDLQHRLEFILGNVLSQR